MTKKLVILGATGSIGRQTLDCVKEANRQNPDTFAVVGLSANSDLPGLLRLAQDFPDAYLALSSSSHPAQEGSAEPSETLKRLNFSGPEAVARLVEALEADLVVNGIAGSAGLMASYESLRSGKHLALANKESVVMAYGLLASMAKAKNLDIIPVDSEHAALFQLVRRCGSASIQELCITASGGPFRNLSLENLKGITPDQAAAHPVWKMGRKISIDSATLANKGLELIEAVRLFGVSEEKLRVLIHPESLVHALLRTLDGSLYANLSSPDMHLPINIALHWPQEVPTEYGRLDLAGRSLNFFDPDTDRFPMLELARAAVRAGEAGTIAYNAANEVAVQAFEEGRIGFTEIAKVVAAILDHDWSFPAGDLRSIFNYDNLAREKALAAVAEIQC